MEGHILILKNWDEYCFHLQKPETNYNYAFVLNMQKAFLQKSYQNLSLLKIPFTIALQLSGSITDDSLNQVIPFLFLPYYHTKEIYVITGNDEHFQNANHRFNNAFKNQNISIDIMPVKDDAEAFVVCDNLNEVQQFKKSNAENNAIDNEVALLRKQNIAQQQQIKLLAAELEIQRMYNEKLRSSHQAKEIQTYYDKQYEILPAWYKKMGNIIKRLMKKDKRG